MPFCCSIKLILQRPKLLWNCIMGSVSGGRNRQLSQLHGSNGSSSSLRWKRKNTDQVCFCGLKTVIKKSGTIENPDRLFHTCPRYRKGIHCNYFKWTEDDEYEGLDGAKGDVKTDVEMESDVVVLNHNLSWRMMSLEAEVRALRMQLFHHHPTPTKATVPPSLPQSTPHQSCYHRAEGHLTGGIVGVVWSSGNLNSEASMVGIVCSSGKLLCQRRWGSVLPP
ncbi:hypothetical protein Ahy_B01g054433 [Arachis hypogaea]|uniref:GRF-type domain-containing protein n=1 Tax=Arachis hypogaea TaxID=3818 RepID=A0A445ATV0_ARAHY|nr:hypothetical protein Ahy_B01g054433 [Arachis hypogaea]